MNRCCWTPPGSSAQARPWTRGRNRSSPSAPLRILCACFLLYLLTALRKPRRNAQAAIFTAESTGGHAHVHVRLL
ncbi:hypothetical protein EYF80_055304 [Liparis tanakae]|uniref:Uncharacterized protein n=1 Tax=Liparis tanakae TaxID=230148 RepID=A0A4Z2EZX1_9TELE|nr:hypothetical protein EYF80_055304 [Liparis tanakae]